jgi:hypothetical protein
MSEMVELGRTVVTDFYSFGEALINRLLVNPIALDLINQKSLGSRRNPIQAQVGTHKLLYDLRAKIGNRKVSAEYAGKSALLHIGIEPVCSLTKKACMDLSITVPPGLSYLDGRGRAYAAHITYDDQVVALNTWKCAANQYYVYQTLEVPNWDQMITTAHNAADAFYSRGYYSV